MYFEVRRKLFHLLAIVYVAGLYLLPRRDFLIILISVTIIVLIIEILRLNLISVSSFLSGFAGGLFRAEESDRFSGILWMLLGVTGSALLIKPTALVATVYLYLILGDAAASLVGKSIGGPKWINSKKRVTGSLACLAVCLIVGFVMLRPVYSWPGIFLGALAATILEYGIVPLNDNLTIPLGSSLVFLFTYGIG